MHPTAHGTLRTVLTAAGTALAFALNVSPGAVPPAAAAAPPAGAASPASFKETVIHYSGAAASVTERWKWAREEAGRRDFDEGYWIGYSIEKMMGVRSHIGTFYGERRRNRPSLGEVLTGIQVDELPMSDNIGIESSTGIVNFDDEDKPRKKVRKEVGILLHLGGRGDGGEVDDMKISNLTLRVDFEGDPLLWLGGAGYEESVTFLESKYRDASTQGAKKEFIVAIAQHEESQRAFEFLKGILLGSETLDIREDAAFWISQTGRDDARQLLSDLAWKDESQSMREKAIFSLTQIETEASLDAIIAIARGHKDKETREQATFWLGQRASDKALGALKDIAEDDEDDDVQRSAVFALTQIEDGGGVDELIRIARTHKDPKTRKDAIFWLGQSEDPRALEVLVEIVKGK